MYGKYGEGYFRIALTHPVERLDDHGSIENLRLGHTYYILLSMCFNDYGTCRCIEIINCLNGLDPVGGFPANQAKYRCS